MKESTSSEKQRVAQAPDHSDTYNEELEGLNTDIVKAIDDRLIQIGTSQ